MSESQAFKPQSVLTCLTLNVALKASKLHFNIKNVIGVKFKLSVRLSWF